MTQINKVNDMFSQTESSLTKEDYLNGAYVPDLDDDEQKYLIEDFGELKIFCYPDKQYGLYKIKYSKGKTPGKLLGKYTSVMEAKRHLKDYLTSSPVRLKNAKDNGSKVKSS
jgi:hypothetical protein